MIRERRSLLISLAWIGGVLLTGWCLWFFTQSYRSRLLAEAVNRVLEQNGEPRRLEVPLSSGGPALLGSWFTVSGDPSVPADAVGGRAFVFTVIRGGVSAACVALTDSSGGIKRILPLSGNAAQVTEELPLPLYRFYEERIKRSPPPGRSR
jgi:hypothetical protein